MCPNVIPPPPIDRLLKGMMTHILHLQTRQGKEDASPCCMSVMIENLSVALLWLQALPSGKCVMLSKTCVERSNESRKVSRREYLAGMITQYSDIEQCGMMHFR